MISDMTPGKASSLFDGFAVLNGKVLFLKSDSQSHVSLWSSDGTNARRRAANPLRPATAS